MPEPVGSVLAFDYGEKHIGVAVGQTVTRTASPLETIARADWAAVDRLVNEWRPSRLLVGLPLNMDDTESDMSARARRFAAELERRTGLPVALVDERLTSYASRGVADLRNVHAAAAALIAETWLNDDS
ncbi:MAG: Holliday junction resolvase RuvX [Pseudomonadales bacterium]|jgi:putative Holliday junction resolvase